MCCNNPQPNPIYTNGGRTYIGTMCNNCGKWM